jgi:hypothetical protein
MVVEDFTGSLLEFAIPLSQFFRKASGKPLIRLGKYSWHSPCLF